VKADDSSTFLSPFSGISSKILDSEEAFFVVRIMSIIVCLELLLGDFASLEGETFVVALLKNRMNHRTLYITVCESDFAREIISRKIRVSNKFTSIGPLLRRKAFARPGAR
jgi:hypothetical protein